MRLSLCMQQQDKWQIDIWQSSHFKKRFNLDNEMYSEKFAFSNPLSDVPSSLFHLLPSRMCARCANYMQKVYFKWFNFMVDFVSFSMFTMLAHCLHCAKWIVKLRYRHSIYSKQSHIKSGKEHYEVNHQKSNKWQSMAKFIWYFLNNSVMNFKFNKWNCIFI